MTAAYGPPVTRPSVLCGLVVVDDRGRDIGAVTLAAASPHRDRNGWHAARWSARNGWDAWRVASAVGSRSAAVRAVVTAPDDGR